MTTTRSRAEEEKLDELYADTAHSGVQPLWLLESDLLGSAPPMAAAPYVWRWARLHAPTAWAGGLVGVDRGGDRRVLALSNPGPGGRPVRHAHDVAVFFENGPDSGPTASPVDGANTELRFGLAAGLVPAEQEKPTRTLRCFAVEVSTRGWRPCVAPFTDPTSGRDVLPTMRCEAHHVTAGTQTPQVRETGSCTWTAARAPGRSRSPASTTRSSTAT